MTAQLHSFPRSEGNGAPPLVPAGVDVRDAPDFRFNIARMLDSDWYHSCTKEEALAGINLNARAIHQVPAGSLPSADGLLARLADFGRDVAGWLGVKTKALEGWVLCSDGRWYQPDVARNALHIWIGRLEKRRASAFANQAKDPDRDFGLDDIDADLSVAMDALRAIDPQDAMLREATARATRWRKQRDAIVPVPAQTDPTPTKEADLEPTRLPSRLPSRQPLGGSPKRSEAKLSEQNPSGLCPDGACAPERGSTDWEFEAGGASDLPSGVVGLNGDDPAVPWPPDDWVRFWAAWPHKVGIGQAERVFARLRKAGVVGFDTLMTALERYKRCKPFDRPWCNPATWLNGKRWLDEWPSEPLARRGSPRSAQDPRRPTCGVDSALAGLDAVFGRGGAPPLTIDHLDGDIP